MMRAGCGVASPVVAGPAEVPAAAVVNQVLAAVAAAAAVAGAGSRIVVVIPGLQFL